MPGYPPIGEHGLIGDLRTCALVSSDGDVDWFCPGRFDGPSVFGSLLDRERGGSFRVTVDGADGGRQLYLRDTAVLTTRFTGPDGIGEVVDFMPVPMPASGSAEGNRIIRILRAVHGTVRFTVECDPRFDYGRGSVATQETSGVGGHHVIDFSGENAFLRLASTVSVAFDKTITLKAGETTTLMLSTYPHESEDLVAEAEEALADTRAFWRDWLRSSTYRGRWPEEVHRSAITLKLLTHAETGAPVAAATAGLPEEIGGERNWDYRFTWVRDGSLTARALLDLGFRDEAEAFARWISDRLREGPNAEGEPLSIMYRVDGGSDLAEEVLPHLSGYQDSAPVRIGNGASGQLQLDIYGEVLFALADTEFFRSPEGIADVASLLDWLADAWDRPDEGIWETRGGRRDFTYSRLMCWTAFEHGLRLAPEHASAARWAAARDAVARQIEERGWDEKQGAYIQSYGDPALDASLLFMPVVGFVAADDPRWRSTLAVYDRELSVDGLSHRYHTSAFADGLSGDESSFDLCSLLFHVALAGSGDVGRAEWEFTKFLSHAGPTGLFAEELTPEGVQLGNYPQAFTHLGIVFAARALDAALDADGVRQQRR